jgi:hypothetical protein
MPTKAVMGEHLKALRELRRKIEDNCDYVGDEFAEEARKIHYGETDPRGIYGETSKKEAGRSDEEGIGPALPWVPRREQLATPQSRGAAGTGSRAPSRQSGRHRKSGFLEHRQAARSGAFFQPSGRRSVSLSSVA